MSTPSDELQVAIYQALSASAAVTDIVGTRIVDGRPSEYPAVTFGPSDYTEADEECIDGREETVQLDCWVQDDAGRMWPAKVLADHVRDALHDAELSLDTHALVFVRVNSVRVMMDPDGVTGHGVVTVTASVEEN